ncbi:hypothetical protein [Streptomyces alfalfae]
MFEVAESSSNNDEIWILYYGATFIILAGIAFASNVYGISEKFFRLVTTFMPAGKATPRTMRVVGAGWVVVGILMFLPEIIQGIRAL